MASANNAKKGANVRMKRKERKNIAAGQAHIQSTFNNTVVTITAFAGRYIWHQATGFFLDLLDEGVELFLCGEHRHGVRLFNDD